jgi:hypothetical protein
VSGLSKGKYVSAITVNAGGVIQVAYGGPQANKAIPATALLTLVPGTDTNNDVVWVCGTAATPAGVTLGGGAAATNIQASYLPTSCHT